MHGLSGPAHALADFPAIAARLRAGGAALYLDYDGTLAPLMPDPTQALMADGLRALLARLAGRMPVSVISGRRLENLVGMVGVADIACAGDHGHVMQGPWGTETRTEGAEAGPLLDEAHAALTRALSGHELIRVERKAHGLAVQYRLAGEAAAAIVDDAMARIVAPVAGLKLMPGKMIREVRPAADWHKGRALWRMHDLFGRGGTPIFIGDDVTDEDGFSVLEDGSGIGICVQETPRPTRAGWVLRDIAEVTAFLGRLETL